MTSLLCLDWTADEWPCSYMCPAAEAVVVAVGSATLRLGNRHAACARINCAVVVLCAGEGSRLSTASQFSQLPSENRTLVASHAHDQGSPCGSPSKQTDRGPQGALLALRYETFPLHGSGTLQGQGAIAPQRRQKSLLHKRETRPGNTVAPISELPRVRTS